MKHCRAIGGVKPDEDQVFSHSMFDQHPANAGT